MEKWQIERDNNKAKIQALLPNTNLVKSGIYVFSRVDQETEIKHAYIGQAKWLIDRLASHLSGYEHIDLSIKKRGFYSAENKGGWELSVFYFPTEKLDLAERTFIKSYADNGYQLLNKTSGGQDNGKEGLDNQKAPKGYHDGLKQGRKKCLEEVRVYFEKYLDFVVKGETNKIKERKFKEFEELLKENEVAESEQEH